MTDEERQAFAAQWRRKYGVSLDEYRPYSSPAAVAEYKAREAIAEVANGFRDRVIDSLSTCKGSLKDPLAGTRESVESRLQDLRRAEKATGKSQSQNETANLFEVALDQLDEFIGTFNETIDNLIGTMNDYPLEFEPPGSEGKKRTDVSLGLAIDALVAHPPRLSAVETDWAEILAALEWFGHDVAQLHREDLQAIHRRYVNTAKRRHWGSTS